MTHVQPVTIILPWPHKDLWQNSRGHWAKRARATAQARKDAHNTFLDHSGFRALRDADCGTYRLSFDFCPPDRRRRDVSNCIAACKAHVDGIADALGMDDSALQIEWPVEWGTVADDGGSIGVNIRPVALAMAAERAG